MKITEERSDAVSCERPLVESNVTTTTTTTASVRRFNHMIKISCPLSSVFFSGHNKTQISLEKQDTTHVSYETVKKKQNA